YSRERLAHYATGDRADWDRLPEWNPPAEPVRPDELEQAPSLAISPAAARLALPSSPDDASLIALGAAAFERYPAQLASYLSVALASRAAASRYGLWI